MEKVQNYYETAETLQKYKIITPKNIPKYRNIAKNCRNIPELQECCKITELCKMQNYHNNCINTAKMQEPYQTCNIKAFAETYIAKMTKIRALQIHCRE